MSSFNFYFGVNGQVTEVSKLGEIKKGGHQNRNHHRGKPYSNKKRNHRQHSKWSNGRQKESVSGSRQLITVPRVDQQSESTPGASNQQRRNDHQKSSTSSDNQRQEKSQRESGSKNVNQDLTELHNLRKEVALLKETVSSLTKAVSLQKRSQQDIMQIDLTEEEASALIL